MTSEKIIAFLEKLLTKTKENRIEWSRSKVGSAYISDRCFHCFADKMHIGLVTSKMDPESPYLLIEYDSDMPTAKLEAHTSEEKVMMLRLFNYVYSLFPTLESSIDKFLNEF